tara:strand:- start:8679 stop:8879 length:201 start_codon:yes stop_codon:yes gene_type:complete
MRQIEIPLFVKNDKNDNEYMIGSLEEEDIAVTIELKNVTFIIFDPTEDDDGRITKPGKLVIRSKSA